MELVNLRHVYEQEGPFATVYLEARSPGEDAGAQINLRWRALRDRLQAAGATDEVLDALEAELAGGTAGEEQANGRVLVANGGGVVFDEIWDVVAGTGDEAYWGELPELGAYVREQARSVAELVVITDQEGAQVRQCVITGQRAPHEIGSTEVTGSGQDRVHKPREGALSHKRIQRRKDETVRRNAKDIAEHLARVTSAFRPDVVVLAGGVQARTALREQLPENLAELAVEAESGGLAPGASEEALDEELLRIAQEQIESRAEESENRLQIGLSHGQAVQGNASVIRAAEQSAVETLLLEKDVPVQREATLLKDCAETDSAVELVPAEAGLTDGVGALLRFPVQK